MVKKHLKRLNMPKIWSIRRKGVTFVARPTPGPHPLDRSIPIGVLIRDLLCYAKTTKEAKFILNSKNVIVDGIRRKDEKFPVGIFDVIEIKDLNKHFRILLNAQKGITILPISKEDAAVKPCKITGKSKFRGKTQLNLYDGKNILVEKDEFKVGDTLLIGLPGQEIKKHIKFAKGASIYLTDGKRVGTSGILEDIRGEKILYKGSSGETIETLKEYAVAIGGNKPEIKLEK